MDLLSVFSISGNLSKIYCIFDELELIAGNKWLIERNLVITHRAQIFLFPEAETS